MSKEVRWRSEGSQKEENEERSWRRREREEKEGARVSGAWL
jgi:hypothetical protein